MKTRIDSTFISFICFVSIAAFVAGLGLYEGAKRLMAADEIVASALEWSSDIPPAGEPIVGIWTDGEFRSHIVVMVYGAAYPYDISGIPIQAIEYNRPELWTRLP